MVARWYDLRLETRETQVRTQPLGKQWSRDYPIDLTLTFATKEALDWRKWTKGGVVIL